MQSFVSDLSGKEFPLTEKVHCRTIRKPLMDIIRKDHPHLTQKSHLSVSELNHYRQKYFASLFSKEIDELTQLEKTVIEKLRDHKTLTDHLDDEEAGSMTLGQRVADKIATFGGSWTFIISFLTFILIWIGANLYLLMNKGFDPYPFILLNLILSCLAALQAPVIMMSQNRQEEKDRLRSKNDYMINLKSELELRILHDKIDHLITHQQQDMMEMQETQVEMLTELTHALKKLSGNGDNHKHTNKDQTV
ncbi:Uncharacterized membrane protein [Chitinophaga sp. CF118]|uniref:DUF1003 domain-containing protein n=1 Tax=Chitinophaga sp. CF118 TaxID=1884367 RepID=UPI0008ED7200|nr:DUF1003 domain-containing protein [Chitinophaga sp. CF118]SFE30992.1 Uncharacterized membrane protein [Chitinophaga sp. CF118]